MDIEPSQTATASIEQVLGDATGLRLRWTSVASSAEALAALCASPMGTVSAVWLNGLSALTAEAQGCGTAALVLERTRGRQDTSVETYQIVASRALSGLSGLARQDFCRVSVTDLETWLFPSLLMKANGIDITSDIGRVEDLDDVSAVAQAVADDDCEAAGISTTSLDGLDNDTRDALTVLEPTLDVAFGVLLYPQQVPLGAREALDLAFVNLADNTQQADLLREALDADGLRPAREQDFASLREAVAAAGLDLTQLGD